MVRDATGFLKAEYEDLDKKNFDWRTRTLQGPSAPHCKVDGKDVIMLCSNYYLNLSNHPKIKRAAIQAVRSHGAGSGSVVFPDLFKAAVDLIAPERLVRLSGTIDRSDKGTKLRVSKIEPLAEVQKQAVKRVHIRLTDRPEVQDQLLRLREVLQRHPGGTTVSLSFQKDTALEAETAPLPNLTVSTSQHFVSDVEEVLGKGAMFLLS